MVATRSTAGRPLIAALVLPGLAAAVQDWIPGLVGRRGGGGGFASGAIARSLLAPTMQYGRLGLIAHANAELMDVGKPAAKANVTPTAEPTPYRHRLVVCNAYRGAMNLAAIHKRPFRKAMPARWQGESTANKTLISGIPFKTCDVSRMEFKEGDSIVFKAGGTDVGSFNTSGALGLSAGQEVSLVLVPYRRLGQASQGAQFVSHVFRTPKQKVGSQVILADTLKHISESVLKMEDRSGRLWPVHDNQEVTLQPGTYQFTALDLKGTNVSSTPLQVAGGHKNGVSAKYLVLRLEPEPFSEQEFLTFSLPVPTTTHSGGPASSAAPASQDEAVSAGSGGGRADAPHATVTQRIAGALQGALQERFGLVTVQERDAREFTPSPGGPGPNGGQVVSTAQLANVRHRSGALGARALAGCPLLLAVAALHFAA